jgi:quercetin dioxygenase-like cupin family protein
MKRFITLTFWIASLAIAFSLGTAIGQQSPPTENKGVNIDKTAAIDLGPEIEGMQGRQLRLRVIKAEPGAVFGVHSHKDRPAAVYVLQGRLTEHREGGYMKEWKETETFTEGKDVTHWAENKGSQPVVLVVADILKQQ